MSEQSVGGAISSAQGVSQMALGMQLSVAMLKKGQDVMQQQGEAMLQLVNAVPKMVPEGSLGHNLDVKA